MNKTAAIIFLLLTSCGMQMYGQSLKDLFNKETIRDIAGSVVEQLDVLPKNIEGTWEYAGTTVKFTGDNILTTAASQIASGQIATRLDEYLQIVGIREGAFSYTFNADSTFTTSFNKMDFPGRYTFSEEANTIELDYGKNEKLRGITLKTQVSVSLTSMELLFNADKLLDFINKISSSAGNSKLSMLNALTSQYDGLKIGFELTRKSGSDVKTVSSGY